jgi:hypothetical protein
MIGGMPDVTRNLSQIESGDPSAAEELLPLVYADFGAARDEVFALTQSGSGGGR